MYRKDKGAKIGPFIFSIQAHIINNRQFSKILYFI